jgi:hypothetical protein
MYQRDYRDIAGGALLLLTGIMIAWYASATLDFGTVRRMGPGMFPMSIGVILAVFGIALMIPAFFRAGDFDAVEWRSAIAVLAGVGAFALAIRPLGLVPAIVSLLVVSSLAERRFRPVSLLVMCVTLPLAAYLIFRVGLGLPLAMARWPF